MIKVVRSTGRPSKIEDLLLNWGVDIASWFEEWQVMNNRVASRDSVDGYVVNLKERGVVLIENEADYLEYALTGRNAGKFPWDSEKNVNPLEQWIIDKGIPLQDISLKSLAYLIGRKIAREGTNQPRLKPQNIDAVINSKSVKWLNRIAEQQAQDTAVLMLELITKNGSFKEKK